MMISRVQDICIKTEPYLNGYSTEELRERQGEYYHGKLFEMLHPCR